MNRYHLLPSLVFFFFSVILQSNANDTLPFFNKIELSSNGKLSLVQGMPATIVARSGVSLSAKDVVVKDSTLYLNSSIGGDWQVVVPALERIELSGYGSITADSLFAGDNLSLIVSGNGKITMPLQYDRVAADITGLGKIVLTGKAESLTMKISGSGKVDAAGLVVSKCIAKVSGVGKCTVDVRDELIADISGSGKVDYVREPARVESKITGIGKVNNTEAVVVTPSTDTTYIMTGDVELILVDHSKEKQPARMTPTFPLLELGLNPYHQNKASIGWSAPQLLVEKSVSVALNLFQQSWELGSANIWLTTRLGFTWNNYRYSGNVQVVKADSMVAFNYLSDNRDYSKSKLTTSYLTVPVLLNFMTSRNPKTAWTFGVGGMLGLRLGSHCDGRSLGGPHTGGRSGCGADCRRWCDGRWHTRRHDLRQADSRCHGRSGRGAHCRRRGG